jgi:hypothetical protein
VVAALLRSQVACPYGRRGRRIRLSGEARVERRLRASVEEGAFEYFGSFDRCARPTLALRRSSQASSLSVSASDHILVLVYRQHKILGWHHSIRLVCFVAFAQAIVRHLRPPPAAHFPAQDAHSIT